MTENTYQVQVGLPWHDPDPKFWTIVMRAESEDEVFVLMKHCKKRYPELRFRAARVEILEEKRRRR